MTDLPQDPLREPFIPASSDSSDPPNSAPQQAAAPSPFGENSAALEPPPPSFSYPPPSYPPPPPSPEPPLFYSYSQPPVRRPVRIPHFGHLMLLLLLLVVALLIIIVVGGISYAIAIHFDPHAAQSYKTFATDLGFNLASEAFLYLITFGLSLVVFPMVWSESLFAGLEWRGRVASSNLRPLVWTAFACFGLAILDQFLMPGPANAPIEKMISSPGAAWMMFAFGVTMAPVFEEMFFRGFLLPSLCTACDWIAEKMRHTLPRPLDADGHPQWSLAAMIIGSVLTSIPFAGLHVEQQGHSLGPFLLLIAISLILCSVRLKFRSLAASTLVHASYNFLIFSIELIATGGFRHFDKM